MDLDARVDRIQGREDFVRFVRVLLADLQENPDGWGNRELTAYLGALGASVEDMAGYYRGRGEHVPAQPSWKTLGHILLAARIYE